MWPIRLVLVFALLWLPLASAAVGDEPGRRTDAHGDPLPAGVRLRLGSARLRDGGDISAASLSPDGKTWAVAGERSSIRLWDVVSGRPLRDLKGQGIGPQHLEYSPDGRFLAVSNFGNSLQLLDVTNGNPVRTFNVSQPNQGGPIGFSADGRFLTVGDGTVADSSFISIWETETGKQFGPIALLQNVNGEASLSPDGKVLATWGRCQSRGAITNEEAAIRQRTVQLWDVPSGKERGRVVVEDSYVNRADFAPDGRSFAVSSGGSTIEVWELATVQRRLHLVGRNRQGAALVFAPDARTLAAATLDGVVQRWDLASGKRLSTEEGPKCRLRGLRYTTNGQLLAWGTRDQASYVWDAATGKLLTPADGPTASIAALAFVDGGRSLASIGTDGVLFLWDSQTGKERRRVEFLEEQYGRQRTYRGSSFAFTSDGRFLLSGGDFTCSARMWEMPSAKEVCALGSQRGDQGQVILSLDGSKLASLGRTQSGIQLWDVESGRALGPLQGLDAALANGDFRQGHGAAFSPDGKRFLAAVETLDNANRRWKTTVYLWDVATGKEQAHWWSARAEVLAFTPDGKALVVEAGNDLQLLEPTTGKVLRTLNGKVGTVVAPVVYSPDGRTMVISTYDADRATRTVQLWELATGTLRAELCGQRGNVTAAAFSPDGRTLATGSSDTTVLLWDLAAVAATGAR